MGLKLFLSCGTSVLSWKKGEESSLGDFGGRAAPGVYLGHL